LSSSGATRAETVDALRLAERTRQTELVGEPLFARGAVASTHPAVQQPNLKLSLLAESIEEQASQSDLAAHLKAILDQCLLTSAFAGGSGDEPPGQSLKSKSPQELLKLLAGIVSASPALADSGKDLLAPASTKVSSAAYESHEEKRPATDFDMQGQAVAALAKRHKQRFTPTVTATPDRLRFESFVNGAELTKDALGRVLEVHSPCGERLSLQYDGDGNLESFQRCDSQGRTHSICRKDGHGVVVRSADGRARAAGESLTVDPHGCLSIHNHDGQMVTIDLVRGYHIERRRLADATGHLSTITAVFAADGFRMTTHFHEVILKGGNQSYAGEKVSPIRFYGRDGSLVEFSGEDDLLAVHPAKVLAPGSFYVCEAWRGKRQAGTAWEAVQEYLELLL
jgi:hypothetical protein